jgi:hypothetical protein
MDKYTILILSTIAFWFCINRAFYWWNRDNKEQLTDNYKRLMSEQSF